MEVDAQRMADSVCAWLDRKWLAGFQPLFGESILTYSVGKYLLNDRWRLTAEKNLQEIDGGKGVGYAAFDLVAERPDQTSQKQIALELKYLKLSKNNIRVPPFERISDDVLKLSYIKSQAWSRFLVVAYPKSIKLHDQFPHVNLKKEWRFARRSSNVIGAIVPSVGFQYRIDEEFEGRMPDACYLHHWSAIKEEIAVSVFGVEPKYMEDIPG